MLSASTLDAVTSALGKKLSKPWSNVVGLISSEKSSDLLSSWRLAERDESMPVMPDEDVMTSSSDRSSLKSIESHLKGFIGGCRLFGSRTNGSWTSSHGENCSAWGLMISVYGEERERFGEIQLSAGVWCDNSQQKQQKQNLSPTRDFHFSELFLICSTLFDRFENSIDFTSSSCCCCFAFVLTFSSNFVVMLCEREEEGKFQVQWVFFKDDEAKFKRVSEPLNSTHTLTVVFLIRSSGTSLSFTRFFQLFSPLSLSRASRSAIEPRFTANSWSKLGIFPFFLFSEESCCALLWCWDEEREEEEILVVPFMSKSTGRLRWKITKHHRAHTQFVWDHNWCWFFSSLLIFGSWAELCVNETSKNHSDEC